MFPEGAPSLLGRTYMAAQGHRCLVVGASKGPGERHSSSPEVTGFQPRDSGKSESFGAPTWLRRSGAARLRAPATGLATDMQYRHR